MNRLKTIRLKQCPLGASADILGRRWTIEIIYMLRKRRRFCELQDKTGGVNPTTLTERLKFLEKKGLVSRLQISEAPLHVEYELTDAGRALLPVLDELAVWAERWLPEHSLQTRAGVGDAYQHAGEL